MKPFTMSLTLAAAIIVMGGFSSHANANSAQYAPPTASAPETINVVNNAEGVDAYRQQSKSNMAEQMQEITPASGGGLSNEQLENWELHRLQRFYNGDTGVTK